MSATSIVNGIHMTYNESAETWEATNALAFVEAIQRVRDLHRPVTLGEAGVFCEHCDQDHPCITIKALDGKR